MSWKHAPLYVLAHDLARWLEERAAQSGDPARERLLKVLSEDSRELLVAVSLALTFPADREAHLRAADERVVRLRVILRLAADGRALAPPQARFASAALDRIGRMIGGWRRTGRRRRAHRSSGAPIIDEQGAQAQAAPTR
jgi:hypothetical protein